ncbi:MAG TPA: MlaD family protein [Verrucomicrobiae bacterium]
MALQDLTPQLRTRLSRMEKAVGWFVMLAFVVLACGFIYYIYNTAERKGWFVVKATYYTFVRDATGLKIGDPVKLMGFDAGAVTDIQPMPAHQYNYNVYVEFALKAPNYGYIWTEGSRAKINAADFLGKRTIEVTRGIPPGIPTYIFHPLLKLSVAEARNLPDLSRWLAAERVPPYERTNTLVWPNEPLSHLDELLAAGYTNVLVMDSSQTRKLMTGVWNGKDDRYEYYTNGVSKYYLGESDESPPVTERLNKLVSQVESNLPNVFAVTNQLTEVLARGSTLMSNLNLVALNAQPGVSNIVAATAHLDHPGALGEWLLPTNLNGQIEGTLTNASAAMASANTNLTVLVENLNRSLDNLANLTSNLNAQVQANTNLLSAISDAVVHADQFVQGLKHHWLLRSAFKSKAPQAAPSPPADKLRTPKDKGDSH